MENEWALCLQFPNFARREKYLRVNGKLQNPT